MQTDPEEGGMEAVVESATDSLRTVAPDHTELVQWTAAGMAAG
jgi:hypothetical protein